MLEKHKNNYHTHTYLCGHATGTPNDLVLEAKKKGLVELGISEHAPMANLKNINSRIKEEDYQTYHKLLAEADKLAKLNNIKLYKGLEIEYYPHLNVYEHYLKELDYLILGQHYIYHNGKYTRSFNFNTIDEIIIYRDSIIEAINTGYFNLICHPDLCYNNIKNPTDEMYEVMRPLIKRAKELDIPLELNANGIRKCLRDNGVIDSSLFKYPRIKFFEMVAEENAKVIISSDSHKVEALLDYAVEECYKIAEELGLNLVYDLDMNYYKKK